MNRIYKNLDRRGIIHTLKGKLFTEQKTSCDQK